MNASQSAGAQVITRTTAILRAVSNSQSGLRTSEVARLTNLPRPTTHRLLTALSTHGFVDRDSSNRWHLGPELYLLGTLAADRYDITPAANEHIRALSEATGESAFLSVRRNFETICLVRHEGAFPIRSFVLFEGKRFPLGVASAGLAILSFLPNEQIESYLRQANLEATYGERFTTAALWEQIRATRERGWALNPGLVVEGSWGMGAAVFNSAGAPTWALSLTGIEPRFGPDRQAFLGHLLLKHAHELGQHLNTRTASPD